MASTASFKGTGLLFFLLLGLQPSSFVSGQNTTLSSYSTTDAATTVAATATVMSTAMSTVSAATIVTATTAQATMTSGISSTNVTMTSGISSTNVTMTSGISSTNVTMTSGISSTNVTMSSGISSMNVTKSSGISSMNVTMSSGISSTNVTMSSGISSTNVTMSSGISSMSTTMASGSATMMAATTVQAAANKATSTSNLSNIGSMTTAMTSTSSSVTIGNSGNTMTGSGTTSTDNTTSWGTSGMTMISCRQFSCNYSDCYSVYKNITAFSCEANITFCELRRQENMTYTSGCIASCSNVCVNNTQTNCTMGCCNSTGCLSSTLASMDLTNTTTVTTVMMTTTTTKAAATTTTAEPTNNLKKCQIFQCTEQNCYKTWKTKDPMPCPLNQPYCELKKITVGSITFWMGGCNANCTRNTWCTTTTETCHQECCNTSITSCLKLDGTLNVPSSATRGPHFPLALVTAALLACLLSIGSLV